MVIVLLKFKLNSYNIRLFIIFIRGVFMENIFLVVIVLIAAYYLYRKLFKSNSCNCGNCGSNKGLSKNDK